MTVSAEQIEQVEPKNPSHGRQIVGSLLVALLLVAITIAIVTAKIGPGLDATEMRERQEQREERLEQREERREERQEGMAR
jgi:hypothetical protein